MSAPGFDAKCPQCREVRRFEEFSRERRVAKGEMAAARGEYKFDLEFKFRCTACGLREEKVVDVSGVLHKWSGRTHVSFRP